jgi:hypothetical protein
MPWLEGEQQKAQQARQRAAWALLNEAMAGQAQASQKIAEGAKAATTAFDQVANALSDPPKPTDPKVALALVVQACGGQVRLPREMLLDVADLRVTVAQDEMADAVVVTTTDATGNVTAMGERLAANIGVVGQLQDAIKQCHSLLDVAGVPKDYNGGDLPNRLRWLIQEYMRGDVG